MTDMGTLGGSESHATGINDSGQVVGWSYTASGAKHAFLFSNGQMTDLGALPGGGESCAYGINDQGRVVGYSYTADGAEHVFLYSNGTMIDLGFLPGGRESWACGINDHGQVAGCSAMASGVEHAYFLDTGIAAPPSIGSLSVSPGTVTRGDGVTLTANDANDSNGTVVKVEFYRDVNGNGVIDPGTDVLLGTDSDGSDGWTWTGSTSAFPLGGNTYMARAQDDALAWSNTVTATGTVKATPTITWSNPADIIYGTALGSTQLDATASVPGTFAYTPASGTVLPLGNGQTLSVVFTPTDTIDYTTATKSVSINVKQAGPIVSSVVVAEAAAPKNGILESCDKLIITWAATSPNHIASQSMRLDGKKLAPIYGPYGGLYYSCPIGTCAAGSHTYSIQSVDSKGLSSTSTGTFNVLPPAPPSITGIVVAEASCAE